MHEYFTKYFLYFEGVDPACTTQNLLHANFFLLFFCRAAQQEIAALSEIAEHLNSKLAANAAEQSGESVDLDNLFAFLSDVQTGQSSNRNYIIDQIGEQMDELVGDLDVEVSLS